MSINKKTSIYDRLDDIESGDLQDLLKIWNRLLADRERTPPHDYIGKCAIRASMILEQRGGDLQPLPYLKVMRRKNP